MSMIEDSSEPKEAGDSLAEDVDGIEDGEDIMGLRTRRSSRRRADVGQERTNEVGESGQQRKLEAHMAPNTRPTTRGIKKNAVT